MAFLGLIIALVGFAIAVASLGMTSATSMRLIMIAVGIAVSLAGIFGVNMTYMKNAVWKK